MFRVRLHDGIVVAILFVLSAFSVDAYRPGDSLCSYSSSQSKCALESLTPSSSDSSILIYPGGSTRCAFDDFTDPAGNFSANATYFFQVFPKPRTNKLLLMLQGGGACIDAQTCNFALQCSLTSPLISTRATASSSGVFNSSDTQNPFRDWNIVYVPYCTGDLHIGDRVLEPYESGLESLFGHPQCLGLKKKTYLNGFRNVQAAFQWARTNFPHVDELLLGGMSAGSLGAQALASYTADLWSVRSSKIHYRLVLDSYVGVLPMTRTGGEIVDFYGGCDSNDLKLPQSIVDKCKAHTMAVTDLNVAQLQQLPDTKWLFVDSTGDNTQRYFYQLAKDGVTGYPFTNRISIDDFYAEMNRMIGVYKSVSSNIDTFFVNGTQHVFFLSKTFYNTVSTAGDTLGNYLTQWLERVSKGTTGPPEQTPTATPIPTSPSTPSISTTVTPSSSPSSHPTC